MTLSVESLRASSSNDMHLNEGDTSRLSSAMPSDSEVAFPGRLNVVLMAIAAVLTTILYFYVEPDIDLATTVPYILIISTCLALSVYIKHRSAFGDVFRTRMQLVLKGVVFIFVALATLRIFNHLTMSLAFPLADSLLDSWDKSLGLDWMAYFTFVQTHPTFATILKVAYIGFDGASLLGFLALVVMGYARRARYFCEIFLITAAICTTIAMFFPAVAAVVYNFGNVSELEGFGAAPGVYHMEQFLMLRTAETPSIDLLAAQGLATFPSFHAAGGILLIFGFLKTRLSWGVIAFSLTMIASVPIFGGHYFIDVLAGTALAVLVSVLNAMRPCYRGLFGNDTSRY